MKKWQILIPSVMIAATPLVALTGCTKEETLKFTADDGTTTGVEGATMQFTIHWDKTKHNLSFPSGSMFYWKDGTWNSAVTIAQTDLGEANVVTGELHHGLREDITDGVLKMFYKDTTAKTGKKQVTIKNIKISILQ